MLWLVTGRPTSSTSWSFGGWFANAPSGADSNGKQIPESAAWWGGHGPSKDAHQLFAAARRAGQIRRQKGRSLGSGEHRYIRTGFVRVCGIFASFTFRLLARQNRWGPGTRYSVVWGHSRTRCSSASCSSRSASSKTERSGCGESEGNRKFTQGTENGTGSVHGGG